MKFLDIKSRVNRYIRLSVLGVCLVTALFISGCGDHNNDDETRVVSEINNMRIILARLAESAIKNQEVSDLDKLLSILKDDNACQHWIKSDRTINYKIAPDIMQWKNYLTSQTDDVAIYYNILQINNGKDLQYIGVYFSGKVFRGRDEPHFSKGKAKTFTLESRQGDRVRSGPWTK